MIIFSILVLSQMLQNSMVAAQSKTDFKAAVYEYEVKLDFQCAQVKKCSREEAIVAMEENLGHYRIAAQNAQSLGAQIILFPEDGLGTLAISRELIEPFTEPIPEMSSNPCLEEDLGLLDRSSYYLQVELSCLAANLQIYISANFATSSNGCQECGDEMCIFNTQAVFNPAGDVVAVYRKYNLWIGEDILFNVIDQPELVFFDTDFGRIGLATCADLLWDSPVVDLVQELEIDTLLLPLYWGDYFPHQLSHSCESAWSQGLQVNILSANVRSTPEWSSGSGIYSPFSPQWVYYHNSTVSSNVLLGSHIPIHPAKRNITWNMWALDNQDMFTENTDTQFKETVYGDEYNFSPIVTGANKQKVCTDDGTFCCLAEYETDNLGEPFALGVFAGSHTKDTVVRDSWYMEMCTIIKCDPKHSKKTCAQDLSYDYDFLSRSDTTFKYLHLAATFSPDTIVYPEVLFDELNLHPALVLISDDGVLGADVTSMPLVSISLFGRRYSLDSQMPDNFCPAN